MFPNVMSRQEMMPWLVRAGYSQRTLKDYSFNQMRTIYKQCYC